MKRFALFVFAAITAFADTVIVENRTSYPTGSQGESIALQWASSAREVHEQNQALMRGEKVSSGTLYALSRQGKVQVGIPKNGAYFRVLVWVNGEESPEYTTNWVEVFPNKTYLLKKDHLVPIVLMPGMGC